MVRRAAVLGPCSRLATYRGIDRLGALVLASEICDWRRFESAHRHMGVLRAGPIGILLREHDPPGASDRGRERQRLSRRFRQLAARKDSRNVVVAAVARELAGFLWAEMTA